MNLEDFKLKCNEQDCPLKREGSLDFKCKKESRQIRCYNKFSKKAIKFFGDKVFEYDLEWDRVRELVIRRDKTCRLWNCLTKEERIYVLSNFADDFNFLSKILDPAHIVPRSQDKTKKYDPENILLISRFFHGRLDTYKNPVTNKRMTSEQRLEWMMKAKNTK
jgi:hypothetical protein